MIGYSGGDGDGTYHDEDAGKVVNCDGGWGGHCEGGGTYVWGWG